MDQIVITPKEEEEGNPSSQEASSSSVAYVSMINNQQQHGNNLAQNSRGSHHHRWSGSGRTPRHCPDLAECEEILKVAAPITISWVDLTYEVPDNRRQQKKDESLSGPDIVYDDEESAPPPPEATQTLGGDTTKKGSGPRRRLLDNVTARAPTGHVLMVMGPSGCGKTTLLDILADRVIQRKDRSLTGDILINGKPRDKWFQRVSSYVPQEDSLLGVFTVTETLNFAARLYSKFNSADERESLVDAIIVDMGLTDSANTRVGDIFFKGLSGGQKRRLSIGIELIKKPSLIFLDEPTSGLDSAAALEIVKHLRQLASLGHTIVTTIHQPSSEVWELADNVLMLSKGRTVYFGKGSELVPYLATAGYFCPQFTNPADFALGLINTDFPNHADVDVLVDRFQQSAEFGTVRKSIEEIDSKLDGVDSRCFGGSKFVTTRLDQFFVLSHRTFIDNLRNPGVFWVRLFMYTMLAFVSGTMYLDTSSSTITDLELTSLLFFVAAFMVFMSVAVLPFFIQERAVFVRERANGMFSVISYVLAKFFQSLPGIFMISLVSTALVVPLAGLEGFGIFLLDLFLSLIVAESFMQLVAALVPHYIIGMALGAGIYGMFMLVEGYLIQKDNIPNYWIWAYYLAFHTYSFRVFMYNQFKHTAVGLALLKVYSMEDVDVTQDLFILVAYIVGFQALLAGVLYLYHTGKR